MRWLILPLLSPPDRIALASNLPPTAFLDWFRALKGGRVNCVACGSMCAPDSRHDAAYLAIGLVQEDGHRPTCTLCMVCALQHPDAAGRIRDAIDTGLATGGRAWGPTHAAPGGVQ